MAEEIVIIRTKHLKVTRERHNIKGTIKTFYFIQYDHVMIHTELSAEEVIVVLGNYIDKTP